MSLRTYTPREEEYQPCVWFWEVVAALLLFNLHLKCNTHNHVAVLQYTLIVHACQMAPDIRKRLGIKLSEQLLQRPLSLFSHPPSVGIINFIIGVIIIVKLFFKFLFFCFFAAPLPPLMLA